MTANKPALAVASWRISICGNGSTKVEEEVNWDEEGLCLNHPHCAGKAKNKTPGVFTGG
jgi:hypothetical protein